MSPHRRNILLFVLLLVCVRAALLLALVDAFGIGEEFSKSGAAKAMVDGLPASNGVVGRASAASFWPIASSVAWSKPPPTLVAYTSWPWS